MISDKQFKLLMLTSFLNCFVSLACLIITFIVLFSSADLYPTGTKERKGLSEADSSLWVLEESKMASIT